MAVCALVLAAGQGQRLVRALPKAFVPLLGKPLLVRSLEALAAVPEIERVVPVIAPADLELYRALELGSLSKLAEPVSGGAERQDSVRAGLGALPESAEWVAVHDAARCLVLPDDVARVVRAARADGADGAAILAQPVRDTIKRVRRGRVAETPERKEYWAAQTPQVFRVELLREALDKALADGFCGTDDAQLVERLGVPVRVVEGDPNNLKITWPSDLAVAEALLRAREEAGTGVAG
jgi:2-C-methyl-D-erythritol 4-phosphate cytidylyltransferase